MESTQTSMSIEEREARIDECRSRQREIHTQFEGQVLPDVEREEFEALAEEIVEHDRAVDELRARLDYLDEQGDKEQNRESGTFQTARPGAARAKDNIYDLTTVDRTVGPAKQAEELRDRALRSVERMKPGHPEANLEDAQGHVERLMTKAQKPSGDPGFLSRYLLQVGSPLYERAWVKLVESMMAGRPPMLSPEEGAVIEDAQRAASIGTTTAGGFAVPYTLDPTIIPTGNWSVNPMRAISRVETISGSNTWNGVSAGDLTATRRAEAAEVGDNMVTLAQPTAQVSRVDAFVPFSYEIDQDWDSFRSEIAKLFQQSKDNEEATSFVTGSGTAPTPQGVITGATNVYTTVGTAAFVVADLYGTKNALPPRFRPNSKYIAEQSTYDLIRQFATASGPNVLVDNLRIATTADAVPTPGNLEYTLLGKPAYEASAMNAGLTTGNLILCVGDFNYYLIVDRVGMSVEVVQNLFSTVNLRPTGQRGLLAFWRNTGKVLSAAAFRVTKTK
jgi:HK97 family phage major capsid protein